MLIERLRERRSARGSRRPRAVVAAVAVLLAVGAGCDGPALTPESGTPKSGTSQAVLPQAGVGSTLFGTTVWRPPGQNRAQAVDGADAAYGRLAVARVFSPRLPDPWSDLERDLGDRPLVVSFRTPPAEVLGGEADERLAAWFRNAPTDRDTYWVYFHEPEAAVERGDFTAAEFRAAWSHVARLAAAAHNPRLRSTVVLMCWTVQPRSGRDWRSYVPVVGVDVLAWDCYAKGDDTATYADPTSMLDPTRAASAAASADWAIAELGARLRPGTSGVERARWLDAVAGYSRDHAARFVTYFDSPIGGDFRLTDQKSVAAWSRYVSLSARRNADQRENGS